MFFSICNRTLVLNPLLKIHDQAYDTSTLHAKD